MSQPAGARTLRLDDLLFGQGFGTRRVCAGLVAAGAVELDGRVVTDPAHPVPAWDGLPFRVQGQPWLWQPSALVLLHKPAGYECSRQPGRWPGVLLLLPAPLRQRGVQPVGRLDQDTTGVLLLTDDGALLHRLTAPKHHVPKVYQVQCTRPVTAVQVERLLHGVVLDDDPQPVRAAACRATGTQALELTLVQGKYHQVKRMVAAVGNHCEALHRSAFGALTLGDGPAAGGWRFVSAAERAALLARPPGMDAEPGPPGSPQPRPQG
jgi:16S rRNA pseudouridine516 synthase